MTTLLLALALFAAWLLGYAFGRNEVAARVRADRALQAANARLDTQLQAAQHRIRLLEGTNERNAAAMLAVAHVKRIGALERAMRRKTRKLKALQAAAREKRTKDRIAYHDGGAAAHLHPRKPGDSVFNITLHAHTPVDELAANVERAIAERVAGAAGDMGALKRMMQEDGLLGGVG